MAHQDIQKSAADSAGFLSTMSAAHWLVVFAALLSSCRCDNHTSALSDEYRFSTQLGDNYHIFWSFDLSTQRIDFAVSVGTTGWVGFGLSPNGQMPRSDVVIGWVDSNEQTFFHVSCIQTHDAAAA